MVPAIAARPIGQRHHHAGDALVRLDRERLVENILAQRRRITNHPAGS